jgi:hypothetical protein
MPEQKKIPTVPIGELQLLIEKHLSSPPSLGQLIVLSRQVASRVIDASELDPNSKRVLKDVVVLQTHAMAARHLTSCGRLTNEEWADLMTHFVTAAKELRELSPKAVKVLNEFSSVITSIQLQKPVQLPRGGVDEDTFQLISVINSQRILEAVPQDERHYAERLLSSLNAQLDECRSFALKLI